ncbi:MAG: M20/M25/M40 family metallo-hydrolase [Acidobacteriota bacterium]
MNRISELTRRRRNSARLALYVSLLLVGLIGVGLFAWIQNLLAIRDFKAWSEADFEGHPAVVLLQEYIAIDTSTPDGNAAAGAEFLAAELAEAGIPSTLERVGATDANLWAILEGDDPRAVVFHHHIDVDPVSDLSVWKFPPFEGTLSGPWLYGRGAFDMKSVAVAQLEAFREVARRAAESGERPARTLIFLATSGEEIGSDLGMRWLLSQRPELTERFAVVLTEGGAVEGRSEDDVKYWGTEFVQKRVVSVHLCSDRRQRLEDLRRELIAEGRPSTGLVISPELEVFLEHYAETRDRDDWVQLLAAPRRLVHDVLAFEQLPGYLQSMFRNEAVPFPVEEVNGGFEMRVALQLAPGADPQSAFEALLPPWRTHGLGLWVENDGAADAGSSADHWILDDIERVIDRHYPGVPQGPLFLPWTMTDARFLRAKGIAAYGFSPFMVLTPEVLNLVARGTVNERIALPGYVEGVEIYRDLALHLAGFESASEAIDKK